MVVAIVGGRVVVVLLVVVVIVVVVDVVVVVVVVVGLGLSKIKVSSLLQKILFQYFVVGIILLSWRQCKMSDSITPTLNFDHIAIKPLSMVEKNT